MKVIGHQHKFMQQIFLLPPIMSQDIDKELRHLLRLKQAVFLECGSGDEVATVSGIPAQRSSHKALQRLKPPWLGTLSQRWKRCATQNQNVSKFSRFGIRLCRPLSSLYKPAEHPMRIDGDEGAAAAG